MRHRLLVAAFALVVVLSACSSDDGGADGVNLDGELDDVHSLEEPTAEMRELAEQQCLDDPELDVGEITALAGATLAWEMINLYANRPDGA